MKTFRILNSVKIRQMILFLFMAGITVWLASTVFHLLSAMTSRLASILAGVQLVIILFFGITTLWVGFMLYASQKAELAFDQEFMRFSSVSPRYSSFLPAWLRPFNIRYAYIDWVERGALPGSLFITGTNGNTMQFLTSPFCKNYGEEILVELKNHLPAECMDKNIELRFKWTKVEVINQIVQLSISLALLVTMAFDPTLPYIGGWYLKDWRVEARFPWLEKADVNSVPSVDEYWVVTETLAPQRILHGNHGKVQEWDVPELSADEWISFISGDENQNPILWLDDRILHFDGQWETIRYQNNATFDLLKYQGRVQGEMALVMQGYLLVRISALTGRLDAIDLPKTAVEQQLLPDQIQVTPQGDFLVLMSSEQASRIFILAKDGWKPQEYPVDLTQNVHAVDVTLDMNEAVWVLYLTRSDPENYSVMKTDMTGQTSITHLPRVPTRDDDYPRYQNLYVDVHDRIWVYGSYPEFMAVFSPVWQGDALVMEQYTKGNSNFSRSPSVAPSMSPDGLIWAFDDTIVKMDTNLADLPAPLPFSLTSVEWGVIRLVILGVQLLYLFYNTYRSKPRKPANRTAG